MFPLRLWEYILVYFFRIQYMVERKNNEAESSANVLGRERTIIERDFSMFQGKKGQRTGSVCQCTSRSWDIYTLESNVSGQKRNLGRESFGIFLFFIVLARCIQPVPIVSCHFHSFAFLCHTSIVPPYSGPLKINPNRIRRKDPRVV
jgi:hypothetical protein